MDQIAILACVNNIRALAASEHGGCPEEYTPEALEAALRVDGALPTEEEASWLVMGKEDEDGASVPKSLSEKFPALDKLLGSIF